MEPITDAKKEAEKKPEIAPKAPPRTERVIYPVRDLIGVDKNGINVRDKHVAEIAACVRRNEHQPLVVFTNRWTYKDKYGAEQQKETRYIVTTRSIMGHEYIICFANNDAAVNPHDNSWEWSWGYEYLLYTLQGRLIEPAADLPDAVKEYLGLTGTTYESPKDREIRRLKAELAKKNGSPDHGPADTPENTPERTPDNTPERTPDNPGNNEQTAENSGDPPETQIG